MATPVTMPKLGLTMNTGVISRWNKKEGESVAKGEILMVVATDKLTFDVESLKLVPCCGSSSLKERTSPWGKFSPISDRPVRPFPESRLLKRQERPCGANVCRFGGEGFFPQRRPARRTEGHTPGPENRQGRGHRSFGCCRLGAGGKNCPEGRGSFRSFRPGEQKDQDQPGGRESCCGSRRGRFLHSRGRTGHESRRPEGRISCFRQGCSQGCPPSPDTHAEGHR